jgi:hypothetical protein
MLRGNRSKYTVHQLFTAANMKFSKLFAAMLGIAATCAALNASASTIAYDRRALTDGTFFSTHDYQAGWTQQSSGISSSSLSDFNGQPSGNSSFTHLALDFNVGSASNVIFQFGVDAGYGGELRVDGALVANNPNDMWWGNDFANAAGVLSTSVLALTAGHHILDGFWAEGCCSGGQAGRFSIDNGASWKNVDVVSLDTLAEVPEPGMLALFGIGLAGLGYKRRKRTA